MKGNSTAFYFDGVSSESFEGKPFSGYLTNDMFTDPMIGNRSIIETTIPGRESPYFYGVNESPLTFTMVVAFEETVTIAEARRVARWLLAPRTYRTLKFENDADKEYEVIFTGTPSFTYVGTTDHGEEQSLIGYMTLTARSNLPYAMTNYISTTRSIVDGTADTFLATNKGDDFAYMDLEIIAGNIGVGVTGNIIVLNETNGSYFYIEGINAYDKIVVDYSMRNITRYKDNNGGSNPADYEEGDPIYEDWSRTWVSLEAGSNAMSILGNNSDFEVTLSYRAPRYV